MTLRGEFWKVMAYLYDVGMARPIAESEMLYFHGMPVVNGLFGVRKDKLVEGTTDIYVQRFICNLGPVNS